MNSKNLTRIVGGFVLILGIAGLVSGETQLANLMNTDLSLDMMRIVLGVMLMASSFMGEKAQKTAFAIFGVVYLVNFITALVSPTMFGLLPHSFGMLDNILHLGGGLLGLAVAFMRTAKAPRTRYSV